MAEELHKIESQYILKVENIEQELQQQSMQVQNLEKSLTEN